MVKSESPRRCLETHARSVPPNDREPAAEADPNIPLTPERLLRLKSKQQAEPGPGLSTPKPQQLLTVSEVAERCGVRPATVRNWIKNGELGHFKKGIIIRVPSQDFLKFIRENKRSPRR